MLYPLSYGGRRPRGPPRVLAFLVDVPVDVLVDALVHLLLPAPDEVPSRSSRSGARVWSTPPRTGGLRRAR